MNKANILLRTLVKRKVMPVYLIVGMTNVCDSRCLTCFAWKQMEDRQTEMTLEQYDRVFASIGKTVLSVILSGGEVFLRKDLTAVVESLWKHTRVDFLAIPTNGIRFAAIAEGVEKILDVYGGNLIVNLSIDGVGRLHDTIRGVPGNFEKVSECYERLVALKKKNPRLSVGVNTVLNSLNQDHYRETFDWVRTHWPAADNHNFEIMRGDSRSKEIAAPGAEFLRKNIDAIKKLSGSYEYHKTGFYRKFLKAAKLHYHDVVLDHLTDSRRLPCYAGALAGVISPEGDVFPCELKDRIGSLADFGWDFKKLWFSPAAEKVRTHIRKTQCICTHSCFQFVNILFNPFEYPRLFLKKPAPVTGEKQ